MLKRKRRLGLMLSCIMLGGVLVGCSKEEVSEKITRGYIAVNTNKYALPLSVKDLEGEGLYVDFDNLGLDKDSTLPKDIVYNEYIPLLKGEESNGTSVKLVNKSDTEKKMYESDIHSLRFSVDGIFDLEGSLGLGNTEDDFKSEYGNPLIEESENGIDTKVYNYKGNGFIKVEYSKGVSIAIEFVLEDSKAEKLLNDKKI